MQPVKRLMRLAAPRRAASWLTARYIRSVQATGRWTTEGSDIPASLLAARRPFLVAFWHGRLLMGAIAWSRPEPFRMVISEHPDGQLIARAVGYLGIDTIAGSSTRGGMRVLRAMVRSLENGICVGVTPDGPSGPRMRVAPGIVRAARLARAPIVPLAVGASPCRLLDTWDRMMVPLPFCRGAIRWGTPVNVAGNADEAALDAAAAELESQLNEMHRLLDSGLGMDPVEPAAAAAGVQA